MKVGDLVKYSLHIDPDAIGVVLFIGGEITHVRAAFRGYNIVSDFEFNFRVVSEAIKG